jgi:hypothetical protein
MADLIIVLDGSRLTEIGGHEELMRGAVSTPNSSGCKRMPIAERPSSAMIVDAPQQTSERRPCLRPDRRQDWPL